MIVVHIGLPKTATTTLQVDVFSKLDSPQLKYIGIVQPRTNEQNELYKSVFRLVSRGDEVSNAREKLERMLQQVDTVVISEEMFTVSDQFSTWKQKLVRLRCLLDGLDYRIICTVRMPEDASFSYFVELHHRFSKESASFADAVVSHEAMKIFEYSKFIPFLDNLFSPERLHIKTFDTIIEGQVKDLYGILEMQPLFVPDIRDRNQKETAGDRVFTGRRRSIAGVVRVVLGSLPGSNSAFAEVVKRKSAPIMRVIDSWGVRRVHVVKPSNEEIQMISEHFANEWAFCLQRIDGQQEF